MVLLSTRALMCSSDEPPWLMKIRRVEEDDPLDRIWPPLSMMLIFQSLLM